MKELAIKTLHSLLVKEGFYKPTNGDHTVYNYVDISDDKPLVNYLRELYTKTLSEGATWDRTTGIRLIPTGIVMPGAVIYLHEPKSDHPRPMTPAEKHREKDPMKDQFEKALLETFSKAIDQITRKGGGVETEYLISPSVCNALRKTFGCMPKELRIQGTANLKISYLLYAIVDNFATKVLNQYLPIKVENFGLTVEEKLWVSFTYRNSGVLITPDKIIVMDLTTHQQVEWREDRVDSPPYPTPLLQEEESVDEETQPSDDPTSPAPPDTKSNDTQKGKETMNTPTTAISEIYDLLFKHRLYLKDMGSRRRSFNHPNTSLADPDVVSELKTLYRKALLEGVTVDKENGIELRPHGIFTPGSIIHLWKFVDYSVAKTMKYFKGEHLAALNIDEIKEVEKEIQQCLAPMGKSSTLGEFWELFFTNGFSSIFKIEKQKIWDVVVGYCQPAAQKETGQLILEFKSPAHRDLAAALELVFIVDKDILHVKTPEVTVVFDRSEFMVGYPELESLVAIMKLKSPESPKDEPKVETPPVIINDKDEKLQQLANVAARIINHVTKNGKYPEMKVPLHSKDVDTLIGIYCEVNSVKNIYPTITQVLMFVIKEHFNKLKEFIPELKKTPLGTGAPAEINMTIGDVGIKIAGSVIQVDEFKIGLQVFWNDDGKFLPAPDVKRHKYGSLKEDHTMATATGGYTPQQIEQLWARFNVLLATHLKLGQSKHFEDSPIGQLLGEISKIPGFEITLLEKEFVINKLRDREGVWALVGSINIPANSNLHEIPSMFTICFISKADMTKLYTTF